MSARLLPLEPRERPVVQPRPDRRDLVARALSDCAARERVLLALLLFERLTAAEAARVLDVPVARIERSYAALLARLRRVVPGPARRSRAPRFATPDARLRRAS
jgi:DNA-directed RNA polymerase specialized sigma24 family protein